MKNNSLSLIGQRHNKKALVISLMPNPNFKKWGLEDLEEEIKYWNEKKLSKKPKSIDNPFNRE